MTVPYMLTNTKTRFNNPLYTNHTCIENLSELEAETNVFLAAGLGETLGILGAATKNETVNKSMTKTWTPPRTLC